MRTQPRRHRHRCLAHSPRGHSCLGSSNTLELATPECTQCGDTLARQHAKGRVQLRPATEDALRRSSETNRRDPHSPARGCDATSTSSRVAPCAQMDAQAVSITLEAPPAQTTSEESGPGGELLSNGKTWRAMTDHSIVLPSGEVLPGADPVVVVGPNGQGRPASPAKPLAKTGECRVRECPPEHDNQSTNSRDVPDAGASKPRWAP